MEIKKDLNLKNNTTIVLVTHEREFSEMAKREVYLVDGKVVNQSSNIL